ncbi:MAG: LamG-like jellyroll fold domain-containing protein [Phycisphaerae bacterium]
MKRLNGYRIRLVLVGVVAAIVLGGGSANADFTLGEPTNLGPTVNSTTDDYFPNISVDGLTLYFHSRRSGSYGPYDIWAATRKTTDDQWGEPVNLGPTVNSSVQDGCPSISADGLSLYFHSLRSGVADLWVTTRETIDDDWREPVNLGPTVNSSAGDVGPRISVDGLSLFFASDRPGGYGGRDLWVTTRATLADNWDPAVNLGPTVNTSEAEIGLDISADGLTLCFSSNRPGGYGNADLWVTTRSTVSDSWGPAANLGQRVNTTYGESGPSISADGLSLYFCDYTGPWPGGFGGIDLWQAPLLPVVDLNGDRVVDSADMCIIVDHWGEDYPLCDIGPTPIGDGIVDVHDLIVLAEHLFEDYRLIAHWKLDEEEGDTAYDIIGEYDATLHGEPAWQTTGGMIDGALLLDGIDDYVETNFILNPADDSFSIFAWIKGGVPGQVIISQADTIIDTPVGPSTKPGSTWLGANPSDGRLMTGLMDIYFGPLESESVITDGQWHHIGLVYDFTAMKRRLYVDGTEVVVDAGYAGGVQSSGGLYIGAGQNLSTGTFFSGLIDDVRIYNCALSAERIKAIAH